MAFDTTDYLEVDATVESHFTFTDRAGNVDSGLQGDNTSGQWSLGSGSTSSSSTGPAANPTGRSGYVYTESSSPALSTTWAMKRNISFNSATQDVKLDIQYSRYVNVTSEFYIEYATVASPNETTDWTILETLAGLGASGEAWVSDTFDFSAISTTTLWIRIRFSDDNDYTNDLAFSTWREYGVDSNNYQVEGITYNKAGVVLGSCKLALFKDNTPTDTFSFVDYTTSHATTGAYLFENIPDNDANYCVRAWKDNTPHVFDVTDYELLPKETPTESYDLYLRSDVDKGEVSPDEDLRLRTQESKAGILITNAGDEVFTLGETNIVVSGAGFEATQSTGKLELGDSAVYASATKVTQSIDTWSDTSIQFDLTIGSLTVEDLWLYVTNASSDVTDGYSVTVQMTPTITSAGDDLFETNEVNIVMAGTNFLSPQSTGKVELGNNSVYASATKVTQSIDTWSDTSIQFDLTIGALDEVDLYLFVTNSRGFVSTAYPIRVYRTPTIVNLDDEEFYLAETNIILDGTNMEATQGTGKVEFSDNSTHGSGTLVSQTINSWSNLQIDFDLVMGALSYGTLYVFVTNNVGKTSVATTVDVSAGPAIDRGLFKTGSIVGVTNSLGFTTTAFLIKDE